MTINNDIKGTQRFTTIFLAIYSFDYSIQNNQNDKKQNGTKKNKDDASAKRAEHQLTDNIALLILKPKF